MLAKICKTIISIFYHPSKESPPPNSPPSLEPYDHEPLPRATPARHNHWPSSEEGHKNEPNLLNQNNAYYVDLRRRANEEGDQMAKFFAESHQAYARGEKALAKTFSDKGKSYQQAMDRLNKEASDWIYRENNKDSKQGEVDLHGLYVKEAIECTDAAITAARRRGDAEIQLIVGKGLHSRGGHAKIRPAIKELMEKHQLVAHLDPNNPGILIVQLNAGADGMNSQEIANQLEGNNRCIVM